MVSWRVKIVFQPQKKDQNGIQTDSNALGMIFGNPFFRNLESIQNLIYPLEKTLSHLTTSAAYPPGSSAMPRAKPAGTGRPKRTKAQATLQSPVTVNSGTMLSASGFVCLDPSWFKDVQSWFMFG